MRFNANGIKSQAWGHACVLSLQHCKEPLILARLCTVKIPGAQGGFLLDDIENANKKAPSGAHLCALLEKEH